MSNAEFDWSYAACRKMDSLARKAYRKATGQDIPAGPVNHKAENCEVILLPLEPLDGIKNNNRCGSEGGYSNHRRLKQDACEPCLVAHREYRRLQREREKERNRGS